MGRPGARPGARPAAARRRQPHAAGRRRIGGGARRRPAAARRGRPRRASWRPRPTDRPAELVGVREGDLDADGERLVARPRSRPLLDEIARLRADREARVALAARALAGSLAGLGESLDRIADDADHEAIDVEALRRIADRVLRERARGAPPGDRPGHVPARGGPPPLAGVRRRRPDDPVLLGGDRRGPRGDIAALSGPRRRPSRRSRARRPTTSSRSRGCRPPRPHGGRRRRGPTSRRRRRSWPRTPTCGSRPPISTRGCAARLDGLDRGHRRATSRQNGQPKRTLARGASVGVNAWAPA